MRLLKIAALVAASVALLAFPAFAQDISSAVSSVAPPIVVPPDSVVVVPYGNWIDETLKFIQGFVELGVGGLVAFILTKLPAPIAAYVSANFRTQVEQVLTNAINYGFNAVEGAVKGKELDVNVGSSVVAEAAQYVVDHGPAKLVDAMGGEQGIKEKIVARLPLTPSTTASAVIASAAPVIQ